MYLSSHVIPKHFLAWVIFFGLFHLSACYHRSHSVNDGVMRDEIFPSLMNDSPKTQSFIRPVLIDPHVFPDLMSSYLLVNIDVAESPTIDFHLTFNTDVVLLDASLIKLYVQIQNPLTGQYEHRRLAIKELTIHSNELILTLAGGLSDGSRLLIDDGAILIHGKPNQATHLTLFPDIDPGIASFNFRSFIPTDLNLFSKKNYPASKSIAKLANIKSEQDVLADLELFLSKKVTLGLIDEFQKNAALEKFSDASSKRIIASAQLRAALLSLLGTVSEHAVTAILDGENQTGQSYRKVGFIADLSSHIIAKGRLQAGQLSILFNEQFATEPFPVLSAWMAHEVFHQDLYLGQHEEVLASVADVVTYMQQILVAPDISQYNSDLVRRNNTRMLALLNSGTPEITTLGVKSAQLTGMSVNVLPRSLLKQKSFESYIRNIYSYRPLTATPGNASLNNFLLKLMKVPNDIHFDFTEATIDYIDHRMHVFTGEDLLQMVTLLKLQINALPV